MIVGVYAHVTPRKERERAGREARLIGPISDGLQRRVADLSRKIRPKSRMRSRGGSR